MSDPRFPRRPAHPDFWLISEVLVPHDAAARLGNEPIQDTIARYVDPKSLAYAADQQAVMAMAELARGQVIVPCSLARDMVSAAFVSAFIAGIRFQQLKEHGNPVPDTPEGL